MSEPLNFPPPKLDENVAVKPEFETDITSTEYSKGFEEPPTMLAGQTPSVFPLTVIAPSVQEQSVGLTKRLPLACGFLPLAQPHPPPGMASKPITRLRLPGERMGTAPAGLHVTGPSLTIKRHPVSVSYAAADSASKGAPFTFPVTTLRVLLGAGVFSAIPEAPLPFISGPGPHAALATTKHTKTK
jgi:hypothetical protein